MFVCTLRRGGVRRLAAAAVCGVVLAGAVITAGVLRGGAVTASAQGGALKQQITGAQDVTSFLQGFGIAVDPTTAEVSTVSVPRKWDESFQAFNEVIKESGLDLSRVKNKKVDKWVVLIPAMTTEAQKSYGVVLVYKNEPKGAYILQKPSGEVLPLRAAASAGASLALTDEEVAANMGFGDGPLIDDPVAAAETSEGGAQEAAPEPVSAEPAPAPDAPLSPQTSMYGAAPTLADAEPPLDPQGFPTD